MQRLEQQFVCPNRCVYCYTGKTGATQAKPADAGFKILNLPL